MCFDALSSYFKKWKIFYIAWSFDALYNLYHTVNSLGFHHFVYFTHFLGFSVYFRKSSASSLIFFLNERKPEQTQCCSFVAVLKNSTAQKRLENLKLEKCILVGKLFVPQVSAIPTKIASKEKLTENFKELNEYQSILYGRKRLVVICFYAYF